MVGDVTETRELVIKLLFFFSPPHNWGALLQQVTIQKFCHYYKFLPPFTKGLLLVVQLTAKIGQELKTKNRKIYQEKEHISF